ncbi:LETM1-related biofilm-associated protein [Winogradskyella ursingii]|uniref:LETM1-related biofilm-associated protein n=1 Tax=Winogradskyella ursingii TaxID=2686079 RepID=UPI0015CCC5F9|nr:LETM1-related biofilm-associated protein [Winogradskyella ursingii]
MNPSASGWIKKLLKDISDMAYGQSDQSSFYKSLKQTGFIYGSNVSVILNLVKPFDFTEEEKTKINLFLSFYSIHQHSQPNNDFINSLVNYYKLIGNQKRSVFDGLFGANSQNSILEKVIHKRIHIDDNLFSKNFNYFLINALLFVDVLGYKHFLSSKQDTKIYVNNLESALETIVFSVIDSKKDKTEYDYNLIKLFESSIRHKNLNLPTYTDAISFFVEPLEKLYAVDLVCMASWTDKKIDSEELKFLNQLNTDLDLNNEAIATSLKDINQFYNDYKNKVAFLKSKNLAQSFYDNSSKVVIKLIKRNSKRLIKELSESKEAMLLLTKSTQRNLTIEEQKKVQDQLLDIFKSIPSLAIFLLPGGMILLPLFVKFIPKLLPSAFDENRIGKDE